MRAGAPSVRFASTSPASQGRRSPAPASRGELSARSTEGAFP
jgi:hypothetical protein